MLQSNGAANLRTRLGRRRTTTPVGQLSDNAESSAESGFPMIPRYGSATAPSITDEELLHLALAYVKRVHGQDPDLPVRVAFLLEALREGRGEWERGEATSAVWPGKGTV
jgi:hypothetical protein